MMALVATSCQRESLTDQSRQEGSLESISAYISEEDYASDSQLKTMVVPSGADKGKVFWSKTDAISISSSGVSNVFTLASGEGTSNGIFNYTSGEALSAGTLIAFYPSTITPENQVWPDSQVYSAEACGPMMATCQYDGGKKVNGLEFSNLGTVLRLNLSTQMDGIKIKSITISADQPLSGSFDITDGTAVIKAEKGSVTLKCDKIVIGTEPIAFNIAIPANKKGETYSNFQIEVEATKDRISNKHVAKMKTSLQRGCLYTLDFELNDFAEYAAPVYADMTNNYVTVDWADESKVKELHQLSYEALVYWNGDEASTHDGIQTIMGCESGFLIRGFFGEKWESHYREGPAGWRVKRPSADNFFFAETSENYGRFTPGQWHQVVYTHDADAQQDYIYIDGFQVASSTDCSSYADLTVGSSDKEAAAYKGFHLGLSYDNRRWFNGAMAEVRVWSRVIAPEELTYAHRLSVDPTSDGLLAYWKFNEGAGDMLRDYSGNGNTGVFNTTPTWTGEGVGPYTPGQLVLTPSSAYIPGEGGKVDVTVTCDDAFTYSAIPDWLTCTVDTENANLLHFKAGANEGDQRTATITFTSGDLSATLTLSQSHHLDIADTEEEIMPTITPEAMAAKAMPEVWIETGGRPITSKDEYVENCTVTFKDPDHRYTSIAENGGSMKIKGRGNTTWNFDKKPWRIKMDKKIRVFGMPLDKNWALLANYTDKTLLRNSVAFEMSRRLGLSWTPRCRACNVYLNGEYQGLYFITEHKAVAKAKVNIDPVDPATDVVDGDYYLEIDSDLNEATVFKSKYLPVMFSDPEEPNEAQIQYIKDLISSVDGVLENKGDIDQWLDLQSFFNHYIVHEISKNIDGDFRKSTFFVKHKGGLLEVYHLWDFDIAFGNANYFTTDFGVSNGYDGWYVKDHCWDKSPKGGVNDGWFYLMFQNDAIKARFKTYWQSVYSSLATIPDYIDDQATMIEEPQKMEQNKWHLIGRWTWPNVNVSSTYQGEIDYLKKFYTDRLDWLNTEISKY